MTGADILKDYLVKVGFEIDSPTQTKLKEVLTTLDRQLNLVSKNQAFIAMTKGALGFVGALAAVTTATAGLMNKVAESHMQFEKLALSMHTTKQIARELSLAQEAVGASLEEIAWIPELREHYLEMRNFISQTNVPKEAEQIWKTIRGIGHEFSKLKILVKQAGEWIAYHLGKYMGKDLQNFKKWLAGIVNWLKENLPKITKNIAEVLMRIIGVATVVKDIFVAVYRGIKTVVEVLPTAATAFMALFAAIALGLKLNPVFMMLTALFLLLEDYWVWSQGKKGGYATDTLLGGLWESLSEIVQKLEKPFKELKDAFKELLAFDMGFIKNAAWKQFEAFLDSLAAKASVLAGALRGVVTTLTYMARTSTKLAEINNQYKIIEEGIKSRKGLTQRERETLLKANEADRRAAVSKMQDEEFDAAKKGWSESVDMMKAIVNTSSTANMAKALLLDVIPKVFPKGTYNEKRSQELQNSLLNSAIRSSDQIPMVHMDEQGKVSGLSSTAPGSNAAPFNLAVTINVPENWSPKDKRELGTIIGDQFAQKIATLGRY